MTDDDLMRLARKQEGTDPSNDIPEVVALTPLELAGLAKEIRRAALEDAHSAVRRCINVRAAEDAIRALAGATET
jgi:triosephosphate isomerase